MITLPPYVIAAPDVLSIDVTFDSIDALTQPKALLPQAITGQHLVRLDGTVYLGIWGSVPVAGLSLDQAVRAVRLHVFDKLSPSKTPPDSPEKLLVAIDVLAYNSKTYFLITDGAGFGEQIYEVPMTGSETVLSALAKINGLPDIASKSNIWVARRSPTPGTASQPLPVDYVAITQRGITQTNYQVMPGDRIYVKAQGIFRFDRTLQKLLTPVERILGVTLLGSSVVNSIQNRQGSSPSTP